MGSANKACGHGPGRGTFIPLAGRLLQHTALQSPKGRLKSTMLPESLHQLAKGGSMVPCNARLLKGEARPTRGQLRTERSLPQHRYRGVLTQRATTAHVASRRRYEPFSYCTFQPRCSKHIPALLLTFRTQMIANTDLP